ncbi:ribosome small subunit-dependent GTPase A [Methylocaldum sp.]|uniref:ribosome small subunit-dependent GTPase A n=1 Tax=Methylocaldum sp. TaxID=1969727 RepID=UPI002D64800A|nr:ribosome small subunit-dependent GTPase A [Methylocaldum sp.]HYE34355.1 ribosome small subunit-dependent GTPase A [Methylocaldum sp.]
MKRGRDTGIVAPKSAAPGSLLQEGLVVAHLGQGLAVEGSSGEIILCHTRRRLGFATVGDRVLWEPYEGNQGRVMEILPRRTVLTRPGHNETIRPVAANLDRVFVVVAPEPEPDWLLVDQYLAACEHRGLCAEIIFNKVDMLESREAAEELLADYRQIGYSCFLISVRTGKGLSELCKELIGQCSMLVGQSGVGKSSLTNALLPDKRLLTRTLSEKTSLGRHTTTTATLYHLPNGGDLIDSPGVAVFGLAEMRIRDLAAGFREFRPWIPQCRFNDCRHISDKGCAVREAVETGVLTRSRYERYLKLIDKLPPSERP